jgi:hypothetical protein
MITLIDFGEKYKLDEVKLKDIYEVLVNLPQFNNAFILNNVFNLDGTTKEEICIESSFLESIENYLVDNSYIEKIEKNNEVVDVDLEFVEDTTDKLILENVDVVEEKVVKEKKVRKIKNVTLDEPIKEVVIEEVKQQEIVEPIKEVEVKKEEVEVPPFSLDFIEKEPVKEKPKIKSSSDCLVILERIEKKVNEKIDALTKINEQQSEEIKSLSKNVELLMFVLDEKFSLFNKEDIIKDVKKKTKTKIEPIQMPTIQDIQDTKIPEVEEISVSENTEEVIIDFKGKNIKDTIKKEVKEEKKTKINEKNYNEEREELLKQFEKEHPGEI